MKKMVALSFIGLLTSASAVYVSVEGEDLGSQKKSQSYVPPQARSLEESVRNLPVYREQARGLTEEELDKYYDPLGKRLDGRSKY